MGEIEEPLEAQGWVKCTTGEKRGLICHNCNLMLGNTKDNPLVLLAAVQYLQRYDVAATPMVDV